MTLALTRPLPQERRRLLPRVEKDLGVGRVPACVMIRTRSDRLRSAWVRLGPPGNG